MYTHIQLPRGPAKRQKSLTGRLPPENPNLPPKRHNAQSYSLAIAITVQKKNGHGTEEEAVQYSNAFVRKQ